MSINHDHLGRPIYFKLQGKIAVPCSILEWGMDYEDVNARTVARTFIGTLWVSTVFIGLDHSFGGDDAYPAIFETMIFDDIEDDYQERCSTWAEAEEMHARAVEIAIARVRVADAMTQPSKSLSEMLQARADAAKETVRAQITEALEAGGFTVKKGADDGSSQ